jgi:hypothetical protein
MACFCGAQRDTIPPTVAGLNNARALGRKQDAPPRHLENSVPTHDRHGPKLWPHMAINFARGPRRLLWRCLRSNRTGYAHARTRDRRDESDAHGAYLPPWCGPGRLPSPFGLLGCGPSRYHGFVADLCGWQRFVSDLPDGLCGQNTKPKTKSVP